MKVVCLMTILKLKQDNLIKIKEWIEILLYFYSIGTYL